MRLCRFSLICLALLLGSVSSLWAVADEEAFLEAELAAARERVARLEARLEAIRGEGATSSTATPESTEAIAVTPELLAQGEKLFGQYCQVCHQRERGPNMLAPPPFAFMDHYRRVYGDDEAAMAAAMISYIRDPSEETTLMPGAWRRFGPMAPMPLPADQLQAIVAWLQQEDWQPPSWYEEHYREEHGDAAPRRGMGPGGGQGPGQGRGRQP